MARMEDGVETTSWFSPGTRIVKCLLRLGWLRARKNPQLGAVYEKNHTRLFRWKSGGGREAKDEVEFGVGAPSRVKRAKTQTGTTSSRPTHLGGVTALFQLQVAQSEHTSVP